MLPNNMKQERRSIENFKINEKYCLIIQTVTTSSSMVYDLMKLMVYSLIMDGYILGSGTKG